MILSRDETIPSLERCFKLQTGLVQRERQQKDFGRLAMIHNRGVKNADLFSMCYKSPMFSFFFNLFSLSQMYIRVLPKESG